MLKISFIIDCYRQVCHTNLDWDLLPTQGSNSARVNSAKQHHRLPQFLHLLSRHQAKSIYYLLSREISQQLQPEVGEGKTALGPVQAKEQGLSHMRQSSSFLSAADLPALPSHQMWSKGTLNPAEQELVELWGPSHVHIDTCLHSFLPCKITGMTAVGVKRGIHSPSGIYCALELH